MIDDVSYLTDTAQDVEAAKTALRAAGLESAPVYVGEPDGLGDSHKNGQVLWAGQESTRMKITISAEGIELGNWGDESADSVLDRFAQFVAARTGAEVELGGPKTTVEGLDLQPSDIDSALWDEFCGSHNA